MKRLLLALMGLFCLTVSHAQLLSWSPPFPTENDAAQTLVITMDATKGNQGLINYTPTSDVYVHMGVITNLSTGASDWRHVSTVWATTPAAYNAPFAGPNKWAFTINGSLRTYFGLAAGETIQKIAILFRNGAGTKVQRNADATDMYVPIYTAGTFNVRLQQPYRQPNYTMTPETVTWGVGTNFAIQGVASASSNMKLYHNGAQIATANGVTTLSGSSTVTAFGLQTIIAEADNGTTITRDTIKIFVGPTSSPVAALPAGVEDGINYGSDPTKVTLVLRAPNKTKATVIGTFNNWLEDTNYVMKKTPDGKFFWITLSNLTAGQKYGFQYKVDDSIKIADPYSTLILDPNTDQYDSIPALNPGLPAYPTGLTSGIVGVFQTNAPTYNWGSTGYTRPDKRSMVISEVLLRDVINAHNWNTLRDTLSYYKRLGVNAIEMMPFNEFEGNLSWGYNPDFYFSADKYYGPTSALARFVDSCHANGIAVVMDIALNHSFGQSPMVQLYWDAANNRPAANSPWFNPVATHPFNVGYDINHQSNDTRYWVTRIMKYWTNTFRIDGFRFDLSKGFTQNNTGNDVNAWGQYDASRIAIWKQYYDSLQLKAPGSYAILEHFSVNQEEKELSDYGFLLWGNMAGNFEQAAMGYSANSSFNYGLFNDPSRGWTQSGLVTYMESHDEERMMYKNINFGNQSGSYNTKDTTTALSRMGEAAAFLLTVPGPKMIYEFQELGYDYSINYCANGTNSTTCRTDRKPIRWDYETDPRRKALFGIYSKLDSLRANPLFKAGFVTNRGFYGNGDASGMWRIAQLTTDTSNITVIGNFDVIARTGTVTFQNAGTWYDYLLGGTFTATGSAQTITLQPGEYHVYVNRNLANTGTTAVSNVYANDNTLFAQVYPNPARSTFSIAMYLSQAGNTSIQLLNVNGQVVKDLRQSFLMKGQQALSFNRAGIANGNYFVRIISKGGTRILPLILQ